MRILREFRCQCCSLVFESLVNRDVDSVSCKECNEPARRIISVPTFHLNGADPGFPTAYDKWARDHEKGAKKSPTTY